MLLAARLARALGRRAPALAVLLISLASSVRALADGPGPVDEEPRAVRAQGAPAKLHFDEALSHYRVGHYRAAIAELKAALTFDPRGKDLLYNLALVHEKLGELDFAIAALERYAEIESDPKELERAQLARRRMQGAKAELAPPIVPPHVSMSPPPMPVEERKGSPWLMTTSAIAVITGVVGVVFGIRALALKPGRSATTGPGTSIDDLHDRQRRAEESAHFSDVFFGLSLVSGGAATALWLHEPSCPRAFVSRSAPLSLHVGARF